MPDLGWTITIDSWGGFLPAYFDNSYASYGNTNQATAMVNTNIKDPNVLAPGPGAVDLTSGDENGNLGSVLVTSILKTATSSNVSFATGANKVYKINATAVAGSPYPLTITGGTYQVATDLIHYKSNLYVLWNDTGTAGEISKIDIAGNTIDVDWGSTVPTGAAALEDAPHYAINGGDDVAYFTNGRYVGTIEGTTLTVQGIDFWENSQTVSVTWNENRVFIAINRPNASGSNFNQSAICKWNGISPTWEGDPIEVSGEIGALYAKNGRVFVWWKDGDSTGGLNFGYIRGSSLALIRRFTGSLPNQAQVGEHDGFVAWLSSSKLYLWGARDADVAVTLSQYMSGLHATAGAFASPFNTILISSTAAAEYSIAKASGYTVTSTRNSRVFKVSNVDHVSQIDLIFVETEQLASGAKVDTTLTYNQGKSSQALTQIAYSASNITRHKILNRGPTDVEDFRIDINHANGSTTNPVKIRSIMIQGHFIKNN